MTTAYVVDLTTKAGPGFLGFSPAKLAEGGRVELILDGIVFLAFADRPPGPVVALYHAGGPEALEAAAGEKEAELAALRKAIGDGADRRAAAGPPVGGG